MGVGDVMRGVGQRWDATVDRYNKQPIFVKALFILVVAVLAYGLPLLRPPIITTNQIDFGGVMFGVVAFALVALGLNIVIGYAGLLDLGYVGFYAVGAYTTAVLTVYHGSWPFFLVLPVFGFFASPLNSLTSRKHEFEADAFAASQTQAGDLVNALVKLYQDNASTLTPDPVYTAFYYSHPPASQRIDRLLGHA